MRKKDVAQKRKEARPQATATTGALLMISMSPMDALSIDNYYTTNHQPNHHIYAAQDKC